MFFKKDNSYEEIQKKSVEQWLEQMNDHEDIEVRGGVRAAKGYIEGLHRKIEELEGKNHTKSRYLKHMAAKGKDCTS